MSTAVIILVIPNKTTKQTIKLATKLTKKINK